MAWKKTTQEPRERTYTLPHPDGEGEVVVRVRRDGRLRRRAYFQRLPDGSVAVRIPPWTPWDAVPPLVEQALAELAQAARRAAQRADAYLTRVAQEVNRQYFDGRVRWTAIRWADNMTKRLASVTLGGRTHGEIRVSRRVEGWPRWVLEYIIAHEFVHLLLPELGHQPPFWETLQQAYPKTERARGFIQGYFFARQEDEAAEEAWL